MPAEEMGTYVQVTGTSDPTRCLTTDVSVHPETDTATAVAEPLEGSATDAAAAETDPAGPDAPTLRTMLESYTKADGTPRVRVADTDPASGLELLCHDKSDPEDAQLVRDCKGMVFDGDALVMSGYPYTSEYTDAEHDAIEADVNGALPECTVYESHEGALLRVFYHRTRWYVSTHRRLDAFRSHWSSSVSFGEMFVDALVSEAERNPRLHRMVSAMPCTDIMPYDAERPRCGEEDTLVCSYGKSVLSKYLSLLDKDHQYMFLVHNMHANRIVCDAPSSPTLMHVGTYVNGVLDMAVDAYCTRPRRLHFDTVQDLTEHVTAMDCTRLQGVIVFTPVHTQCKVLNSEYVRRFRARGNVSSVLYRYLQLRTRGAVDMTARERQCLLREMYPELQERFHVYDRAVTATIQELYMVYVRRYIYREYVHLPRDDHTVLKACLENRLARQREGSALPPPALADIDEQLWRMPARRLNHLVKHHVQLSNDAAGEASEAAAGTP